MAASEFLVKLGKRIKSLRVEKNISQITLASLCGFEKASMSRIESGKSNPTALTLQKISQSLGVHISELFKD